MQIGMLLLGQLPPSDPLGCTSVRLSPLVKQSRLLSWNHLTLNNVESIASTHGQHGVGRVHVLPNLARLSLIGRLSAVG